MRFLTVLSILQLGEKATGERSEPRLTETWSRHWLSGDTSGLPRSPKRWKAFSKADKLYPQRFRFVVFSADNLRFGESDSHSNAIPFYWSLFSATCVV